MDILGMVNRDKQQEFARKQETEPGICRECRKVAVGRFAWQIEPGTQEQSGYLCAFHRDVAQSASYRFEILPGQEASR